MSRERRDELLAQRALWGLDETQAAELNALGGSDDWTLELTAATLTTCFMEDEFEAAPAALIAKLQADAKLQARQAPAVEHLEVVSESLAQDRDQAPQHETSGATSNFLPWLLAAAATLLAALLAWGRLAPGEPLIDGRAQLIASASELRQLDWNQGPSPRSGAASGDVVWSDAEQIGYMRFSGLPSNDPSEFQYQLWIFDGQRDAARPVDGGVFDIDSSTGEVIVKIDAKIIVHEAAAFAVTIEQPGGVVVSDREHIVATAGL